MELENKEKKHSKATEATLHTDVKGNATVPVSKEKFVPSLSYVNEKRKQPNRRSSMLSDRMKNIKLPLTIPEEDKTAAHEMAEQFKHDDAAVPGSTDQKHEYNPSNDDFEEVVLRERCEETEYRPNISYEDNEEMSDKKTVEKNLGEVLPTKVTPCKQYLFKKEIFEELLRKTSKIRDREQSLEATAEASNATSEAIPKKIDENITNKVIDPISTAEATNYAPSELFDKTQQPIPKPRYSVLAKNLKPLEPLIISEAEVHEECPSKEQQQNSPTIKMDNSGILKMVDPFLKPIQFSFEPHVIKMVETMTSSPQQIPSPKPSSTAINENKDEDNMIAKPNWESPVHRFSFSVSSDNTPIAKPRLSLKTNSDDENKRPKSDLEIMGLENRSDIKHKIEIHPQSTPEEPKKITQVLTGKSNDISTSNELQEFVALCNTLAKGRAVEHSKQLRVDLVKIIESFEGTKIDADDLIKFFEQAQNYDPARPLNVCLQEIPAHVVKALTLFTRKLKKTKNIKGEVVYQIEMPAKDKRNNAINSSSAETENGVETTQNFKPKENQVQVDEPKEINDDGSNKAAQVKQPSKLKLIKVNHADAVVSFENNNGVTNRTLPIDDSKFEEIDLSKVDGKVPGPVRCQECREKGKVLMIWFAYVIVFTVIALLLIIYGDKLGKKMNIL